MTSKWTNLEWNHEVQALSCTANSFKPLSPKSEQHQFYVFMLGALGIMRTNGGYVMRTAFRRVPHAYCWVVFK